MTEINPVEGAIFLGPGGYRERVAMSASGFNPYWAAARNITRVCAFAHDAF
jgi:hypothetical protein